VYLWPVHVSASRSVPPDGDCGVQMLDQKVCSDVMSTAPNIAVSVGTFADYINVVGPKRVGIIDQQTARYLDPGRPAWYSYAAAETAVRAVLAGETDLPLARMMAAPPRNMPAHYAEIAAGIRTFVAQHRTSLVPVGNAAWSAEELTVNVRQHVGLRVRDAEPLVTFVYLKQLPLTSDAAKVVCRILEIVSDDVLPGAGVAVLDVRRAKLHRPNRRLNRSKLDRWLEAEATGYVRHWRSAVA